MRERIKLVGVKGVAAWCGVDPSTVSQWLRRHWDEIPEPDGSIGELDCTDEYGNVEPERIHADWGWKPERRHEWQQYGGTAAHYVPVGDTEGSTE